LDAIPPPLESQYNELQNQQVSDSQPSNCVSDCAQIQGNDTETIDKLTDLLGRFDPADRAAILAHIEGLTGMSKEKMAAILTSTTTT